MQCIISRQEHWISWNKGRHLMKTKTSAKCWWSKRTSSNQCQFCAKREDVSVLIYRQLRFADRNSLWQSSALLRKTRRPWPTPVSGVCFNRSFYNISHHIFIVFFFWQLKISTYATFDIIKPDINSARSIGNFVNCSKDHFFFFFNKSKTVQYTTAYIIFFINVLHSFKKAGI